MAQVQHGQVAVSGSAQQVAPSAPPEGPQYRLKALSTNTGNVFIGTSASVTTSTGYPLAPGEEWVYDRFLQNGEPVFDVPITVWYVVGTNGDKLAWTAHS